jgi:MraZ protein
MARIEYLNKTIDHLDPYSEERDAFATAILAGSVQLSFDPEGRVILPEELMSSAHLSEHACFVGKGETFEIWQPETFNIYAAKARELAKEKRSLLRFQTQLEAK